MLPVATEPELLAAAREGDRAATEALLVGRAPMVIRFAHAMCDNPADAEDAAQDALLAAVRGLPALRADAALNAWLYAITRSCCTKKRRRRKDAPAVTEPVDESTAVADTPGPDAVAAGHELGAALTLAIRALAPKYREVLLLRDVEGLTAPEVAEVLGLDVGTVKTRLHRARAAVRARIEPSLTPSSHPSPSCPDIVDRFSRFLEGEIGPNECELLHAHVATCPSCNAACASLRRTVTMCREQADEPTVDVRERVRAALSVVVGRRAHKA